MNISKEVEKYIELITTKFPAVQSCWLIGSRANGTSRVDSDWDLLVFADQEVLEGLRKRRPLRRAMIDVLVVYDGDNFEEPWPRGGKTKNGSLTSLEWTIKTGNEATYESIDYNRQGWLVGSQKEGEKKTLKAKKLWSR